MLSGCMNIIATNLNLPNTTKNTLYSLTNLNIISAKELYQKKTSIGRKSIPESRKVKVKMRVICSKVREVCRTIKVIVRKEEGEERIKKLYRNLEDDKLKDTRQFTSNS